jgi:hypothetical protein
MALMFVAFFMLAPYLGSEPIATSHPLLLRRCPNSPVEDFFTQAQASQCTTVESTKGLTSHFSHRADGGISVRG